MENEVYQNSHLRRMLNVYHSHIDIRRLNGKAHNGSPPLKDAAIIITNGDDSWGRILLELIQVQLSADEVFYEGQPFVVCDRNVAIKFKNTTGVPVVVVDDEKIDVFKYES
jgi:hypothetical protein